MTKPYDSIAREILQEMQAAREHHRMAAEACHKIRAKYIKQLAQHRNRNVIIYYSGWLYQAGLNNLSVINDRDFSMISSIVEKMDGDKGLDLVMHLPGGEVEATQKIIDFLLKKFPSNIETFIPQLVLSAGTAFACASHRIYMGLESSLGVIDPHVDGYSAFRVIADFEKAKQEADQNGATSIFLQHVLEKYPPTLASRCKDAIKQANSLVEGWLAGGAVAANGDRQVAAKKIASKLSEQSRSTTHSTGRIGLDEARKVGLKVSSIDEDNKLKELIQLIHRACEQTLRLIPFSKIVEGSSEAGFNE